MLRKGKIYYAHGSFFKDSILSKDGILIHTKWRMIRPQLLNTWPVLPKNIANTL